MKTYEQLKQWREKKIKLASLDHEKLNEFHDELMVETVNIALRKVESEWGPPPTHFAFFVMGSAGRKEQSVWSDQDHGIIFESGDDNYFLTLGEEIANGLSMVGYDQCDGNVMASNPRWCKSLSLWEKQIATWLDEADWESLRYFSTFFDSRVMVGEDGFLLQLKEVSFQILKKHPYLYKRLYENVGYIKKGFGIFGQLLPEDKGENQGTINLKQTIFFPYVNSLRLLALVESISQTSTIERFQLLPKGYETIKQYENDFIKLLNYRLFFQKDSVSYKKVHLLRVNSMSSKEKQALKDIMKKGRKLFKETKAMIDRRCQL